MGSFIRFEDEQRDAENSVGYLLWQTRLMLDLDLDDVEYHLKIRRSYIQAIEQDDYHELPGLAYALGYLKNYALFLGLDPEIVSDRFVKEQEAFKRRQRFYLPMAMQESLTPQHLPIFSSLLLMALIYGVWYGMTGDSHPERKPVDPVPTQLTSYLRHDHDRDIFSLPSPSGRGVQLIVSDNVWVRVTDEGGGILMDRFFRQGERASIPDGPGMQITVGDARVVRVSREGRALEWPAPGEVGINATHPLYEPMRHTVRDYPLDTLY